MNKFLIFDFLDEKDYIHKYNIRGMEQLVARRAHNPKVIGSSPIPAIFSS